MQDTPIVAGNWEEYNREHDKPIFTGTYTYKCHRCGGQFEAPNMGRRRGYCDSCRAIRRSRWFLERDRKDGHEPAFRHADEVRKAVAYRREQGESASHIAQALGLASRNVVIGLWHRMGLCSPLPKIRQSAETKRQIQRQRRAAKRQQQPARRPTKARAKPAASPLLLAPAPLQVNLIALTEKQCRWPTGEGYCGHPKWEHHKSYCEHHAAVGRR